MSNFPIQLKPDEKEEWHEAAKADGFESTAAWVRRLCRERIRWLMGEKIKEELERQENSND